MARGFSSAIASSFFRRSMGLIDPVPSAASSAWLLPAAAARAVRSAALGLASRSLCAARRQLHELASLPHSELARRARIDHRCTSCDQVVSLLGWGQVDLDRAAGPQHDPLQAKLQRELIAFL